MKKLTLVGLMSFGTLLEWAEYTFYGYMAVTLSHLFFSGSHPHIALIKTYGIFAAGYLMRPLGALFFGHMGDRFGRKPALVYSLLLMGIATLSIGCLPTYERIGILAPCLLLVFRMVQGIAISGEYNGAGIFLMEKNPHHKPCFVGSWISASAATGMALGGIGAFLASHPSAPLWAWRLPFLLGGFSCFLGMRLRKNVEESPLSKPTGALPVFTVFREYKASLIRVGAIAAFTGIFVYIGNIYIVSFLTQEAHLPTHHAAFFAIFGEILVAIFTPLMALLADYTNRPYEQYRSGLLCIAVGAPIIFMLAVTGHYVLIGLAMVFYAILNSLVCGPMVKLLFDQFPSHLRYTGISVAWSLSAALFSGTSPLIAQMLVTHWKWGPSVYISIAAILTYWVLKTVKNPAPMCNLKDYGLASL